MKEKYEFIILGKLYYHVYFFILLFYFVNELALFLISQILIWILSRYRVF